MTTLRDHQILVWFVLGATGALVVSNSYIANSRWGLVNVGTGAALVVVSDSVFSNNNNTGVSLEGGVTAMLRNVLLSHNGAGVTAANDTVIRVTRSTITDNSVGLFPFGTGQIISFGDNSIAGNTSGELPTGTIALK